MYNINRLLKLDEKIYHTGDLAIIWGTTNKNTLYTAIKRYVKNGILIPIYKGLYSTVPIESLDANQLGVAIAHRYCYLGRETILFREGAINQVVYYQTFISDFTKRINVGGYNFSFQKLPSKHLYSTAGLVLENGVMVATLERAVADKLYFSPMYYFDNPSVIDFKKVKEIQKEVGYL